MEEKRNYEILKFVMHGDKCYMSTDIVKGKPLIVWLKYHAHITKEQFYEWARQIIADLDHFHRCRGNPCYQYVNPYSVIVGEDRKVYLLDLASKEQEDMMHLMQRRYVRENFLSPENQYSEKRNGSKKIMYVMIALAVIGLLVLSGNRIVSCISGQSRRQGGQDTKLADTERKEDMKAQAYQEQFQELKEQWETERKELQDESSKREQELLYDLAFVYFSQMKDYEVCSRYLEEMKEPDAFAKDMVRLCGMMSRADGEDDNTEKRTEDEEESVEMLLERMRQEIPDEEDERYAECIEFAKEQLQKEDVVEEQTSGEES